jgi:endonuclease YncB( thermonuclease family)
MNRLWHVIGASLLLIVSASASAADFTGVVTHVTDGDTLWVRPASGGAPRQVRIEGIDAPETCQAFGADARKALAARVLRRQVNVRSRATDSYHRALAHVSLGDDDLGSWMVGRGFAWSYRFHNDPGPYAQQQARAKTAGLGLWHGDSPVSPREFRVRHGSCARIKNSSPG